MTTDLDPNLPVIVGVGQVTRRVNRGEEALEPAELMAHALRVAAQDCRAPQILRRAGAIRTVGGVSWRYPDPGAAVAERIDAHPQETATTIIGGNMVQSVVNTSAMDIQMGRADVVLIAGAEAWWTRSRARRDGISLDWSTPRSSAPSDGVRSDGGSPTRVFGEGPSSSGDYETPTEQAAGVRRPLDAYPLFEIALRADSGRDPDKHRAHIGALWSRFSEVAADNPYAWIQQSFTADEIITPSAANRMVTYPYTKHLTSNSSVDQGAAVILCSVRTARGLGIDPGRWVFPHAGTDAGDAHLSNRSDLHSSAAIRIAGRAAMDLAGLTPDEVDHVDLYSCFPSAVQIAAAELGFDPGRSLTVTGGMTFAGGPLNSYGLHGLATMTDVLREDPGATGLCTGNGGHLTNHSFGLYAAGPPPARRYRHARPQAEVDAVAGRSVIADHVGGATIETYSVTYDRAGHPERAVVPLLTDTGARTWGHTTDRSILDVLVADECVGMRVHRGPPGTIDVAEG